MLDVIAYNRIIMSLAYENTEFLNTPAEQYLLGDIQAVRAIDKARMPIAEHLKPAAMYEVDVSDPYVEQFTPAEALEVHNVELAVSDYAKSRREAGLWERKQGTVYFDENGKKLTKKGWGDPVTRDHFFNQILQSPAIDAWRDKMPSAEALADLSDPMGRDAIRSRLRDSDGNTIYVPMDDAARKWLVLCEDAKGIRSRASVMANVVTQFIDEQRQVSGHNVQSWKWASIACGTALPAMKAAMRAGIHPEMLLVDLDKSALQATRDIAEEIGFDGAMSQRDDINIFVPKEMARLREELGSNGDRPMLIDLMGIFEYTGNNLGVDPVQFLRSVYDMLHPGGRLVFGQMRDDRPVPDFTMGVVSWPYVEMRSPEEFMEIIEAAGIPVDATKLYLPSDNVYTVGVIDKPRDQETFAIAF
jgi:SAM-dependent methyltransferase